MTSTEHLDFHEIDSCLFDVFAKDCFSKDAVDFAEEWRAGYYAHVKNVSQGGEGTTNADIMHRQVIPPPCTRPMFDHITDTGRYAHHRPRWSHLEDVWGESDPYEDTIPGLTELKRYVNILALSNGNFRLLLDLAKNQGVPWDGIFSSELNKKVYKSAAYHLSLPPHKIAMVAAHRFDLIAAASAGFKTIYVPRPAEDSREIRESMRSKKDGGEVDLVVKDFEELARLVREARES
ncbi:HAD-like domain-containing protein [Suillus cothurnatus]|nr:HAD-like domain-containing protein [Suillus cothurnatus]